MIKCPITIIKDVLDLLAEHPHLSTEIEKHDLGQRIINALADYPRPNRKGSEYAPIPRVLCAFFYIQNARNYIRLSKLGEYEFKTGFVGCQMQLEKALSKLID